MTDDRDDVLGRILDEQAGSIRPAPDWDDVRRRARRRRRRWLPAAAALVLLVLVTAVFALDGDDERDVVADDPGRTSLPEQTTITTAPTTEHSTATTSTSTTVMSRPPGAGPVVDPLDLPAGAPLGDDEVVASVTRPNDAGPDDVAITVLSGATGDTVRTLADQYTTVEGGVYGLTLSPDRRTVLYVVATSACTSRIDAVATDGSSAPVTIVEQGNRAAISPDGTQLAVEAGPLCAHRPDFDVIPVDGGQVLRYPDLGGVDHSVESMAFASDGRLLFTVTGPQPGDEVTLWSVDLSSGALQGIDTERRGTEYTSLSNRDGLVTALERGPDGNLALVVFDGHQVVDRHRIEAAGEVTSIAVDDSGSVFTIERGADSWLTVDGRPLRQDVAAFAV